MNSRLDQIDLYYNKQQTDFQHSLDIRFRQLRNDIDQVIQDVPGLCRSYDHQRTVGTLQTLKTNTEAELDLIQSQVRAQKDKQAELLRRFEQLSEPSMIEGIMAA